MSQKSLKRIVGSITIIIGLTAIFLVAAFFSKSDTDTDGPHLIYNNDGVKEISYQLTGRKLKTDESQHAKKHNEISINIPKENISFNVQIAQSHEVPDYEYPEPDRILVTSDIEGDINFFVQILRSNGVITKDYNWNYGDGHLVIIGDVFDRGKYVTECLWLIYKLEHQAKQSGGQVHFLLGNHEIMSLQGDHRYIHRKYKRLTSKTKTEYKEFFALNTELGKWLRTKNTIEKIGNRLFVHGGVSPDIINNKLSINQINQTIRRQIDSRILKNNALAKLIMGTQGPMWYRGYIEDPISSTEIKKIREYFDVEKIIIGHTLVKEISSLHDNQVYAVDANRRDDSHMALLVEYGHHFVVGTDQLKIRI